ncbi:MAG: response regulator [Candidatus Omnitrophica bacterium]|nr:response regulator [Candidatus Omnitrophota bacterium]
MSKKNILVADDEPMVVDFLAELLEKEGYNVTSSANGDEALEKANAGGFNLIMIDADMVSSNDLAVCGRGVPVILMSGTGIGHSLIKALKSGADDYIQKPSDIGIIRKKVKQCLEKNAFTLIELLMVCVIVILCAVIIGPKLINFVGVKDLEMEAARLRAKIRYTQQLAVTRQTTYRLEFDLANESYAITYDSGGAYTTLETTGLKEGIGIKSTTFTSPAQDIVSFDYFGAPSQSGHIILKDARNGRTADIGIAAATGRVDIK